MFPTEAERLRAILLAQGRVSPLLNLGSSTGHFRTVTKPHIEAGLFAPLRRSGIAIVHSDLKQADGPAALAALFTRCAVLIAEELTAGSFADRLKAEGTPLWRALGSTLLWLLAAPVRPRSAAA